jgi:hypothetical protein
MRATTANRVLEVDPGSATSVTVDVVNTGDVIDGITANVIGLPADYVRTQPALLPLFPAAAGQLTVSLAVPATHPAGRHPLTVELVSHGARVPAQHLDVDLDVSARPSMAVRAQPRTVRARRSGRFVLEIRNDGNVPLDVSLQATDVERASKAVFTPAQLRVEAGAVAPVLLHVRGPRMLTGAEVDRPVQVLVTAARADVPADADPDAAGAPIVPREVGVKLRQRPLISRGLLTALILASIVALWAGVFLLGLTKVFSNDPMTKAAPASFFVSVDPAAASGAQNAAGNPNAVAAAAPAGALPKSGQLPAGLGGQITGVVSAASTEQPVGRILVQAWRKTPHGKVRVSSSATQSDGTYTLAGLFPTQYYLEFSAVGFTTVWYPGVPSMASSRPVGTAAQGTTSGINAVIAGLPASISGKVDPGDTVQSVRTQVTARPLDVVGGSARSLTVTTGADNSYTISGLAAPASYQLTFTTANYQTSTLVDAVNGGDKRLEPTVTLGASQGGISGVVVNGTSPTDPPIGGAKVSTTVGGKTLTVLTPTAGAVGHFVLPNLPTPATYVLSYSAPGHGTWTEVVDLSAGQSYTKAIGKLTSGSGTVSGVVLDGGTNAGLGGVTVTVGGAVPAGSTDATPVSTAPSTTTLTAGTVGQFFLNGLTDGQYTLTFTLDRYTSASVPVRIEADKKTPDLRVRLYRQLGEITGVVYADGVAYAGATVIATDGRTSYTATSSAAGGILPAGGYDLAGLPPGTYSVTATAPNRTQQTRIVTVPRGQTVAHQDLDLAAS